MEEQHDFELPPPHNAEAEQAVLGSCLIDPGALETVAELLMPEQLYRKAHQTIYEAILELRKEQIGVDLITVTAYLQDSGDIEKVGGVAYLANIANSVPTTANVDHYVTLVIEKYVERETAKAGREQAAAIERGDDPNKVIDLQVRRLQELQNSTKKKKPFAVIKDVLMSVYEQLEARANSGNKTVTGIPAGYPDLDKMTAGFQRSDLIILAARPAVGKTAFALNVAQNIAIHERETVAIFSLEMGAEQLVQRMICAEGNIDAGRMRTGQLAEEDWPKVTLAVGTLAEAPIFIDDTPGVTVAEIRAKCRRLKAEKGLGLVMIDYLQLITSSGKNKGENRTQEVSEISRELKLMARELDVPVIALSQLSRSVEQRSDKRPMMSDLRESGSIEQDADIVAFLYRDDYYNPESERKNIVEFIIAKQRNGSTGTVELVFLKNFNKFVSLERAPGA